MAAQSIESIELSNTNICAGEELTITFEVENKQQAAIQFTTNTIYTLELGIGQGNKNDQFIPSNIEVEVQSENAPLPGNKERATIILAFLIPDETSAQTNYVIRISSQNPVAGGTKKELSGIFEVFAKPATPVLSNNAPICSRETLTLSADNGETNVTYNWTGPNGYQSSVQNPVISNATANMSGDYKVVVINDVTGCRSTTVTQTILVKGDNIWNGSIDSNWNNADNWDCVRIPDINENVRIPGNGITNYPVLDSDITGRCKDLVIENQASLLVRNNNLEISGVINSKGSFDAGLATIVMQGSVNQIIPASTFLNNRIENLLVNNSSGVSLAGILEVTGSVLTENGNLNSAGYLTLISNAIQTALIDGSGSGEVTGNVTMQRYLDPSFGYKYFGSPFSNSTIGDFSGYIDLSSAFSSVYNYNEAREDANNNDLSGWSPYTDATSGLNVLEGYAFNLGANATAITVELTGMVNNGPLSRTLTTTNGRFTKGFHLVSNPYPSPIDWNLVPALSTNIDGAAYFFRADASDEFGGSYTSFVADISSSGGSGSIIPSMQGFFVHASEGSTSSFLNMDNSVRKTDFAQEFYKNQEITNNRTLVRISAGFEDENFQDPLVIYFDNFTSPDFEKNSDALKLYNSNSSLPNFYSITSDGQEASINGMPKPEAQENKRIPLGIKTERSGIITFQLEDLENFSGGGNLFLIDQERRVSIDLQNEAYHLPLEKGEYKNRFFLAFSPNEFGDPSILFDDAFSLKNNSEEIGIRMNLKETESGQLRISTITGQLLKLIQVTANEEISFHEIKTSGVYLVTFISNDRQFSKKVIVRK